MSQAPAWVRFFVEQGGEALYGGAALQIRNLCGAVAGLDALGLFEACEEADR
ncbi:MAG: hypothetical protein P4L64_17270 [Caulobacteraceae bacterium]|nr:hypothetical protein [Caulobacteraceae bacterium]